MFLKRKCECCKHFSKNNELDRNKERPEIGVCHGYSAIVLTHKDGKACGRFNLAPEEEK
ncbi:hypothetical protein [Turicimonas muris]|uniref:hypothetical protein n=1 Tax=Turicimonas muris TaxID=1796652 RepID=UPI0023F0D5A0|nr:hypothetical protein [Turicimonas muris]